MGSSRWDDLVRLRDRTFVQAMHEVEPRIDRSLSMDEEARLAFLAFEAEATGEDASDETRLLWLGICQEIDAAYERGHEATR